MLRAKPVTAQLEFLEPVASSGMERRVLAGQLEGLIAARL
jgi:hypothetical protein